MKTLSIRALLFGMALALAATLVPPTASAASPNLFATVAANGTLVNGNGVSSVTHTIGTGQYEVTFTSNVSSCAYVSTTRNAFSQAIQSYTAGGHLSASGVYVEVKNQGGGLMDGPFDLAVACNLTGWDFAVVGYTANLVRSSPGATLNHVGVGRYLHGPTEPYCEDLDGSIVPGTTAKRQCVSSLSELTLLQLKCPLCLCSTSCGTILMV